jgi:hypothetical protein
VYWARQYILFRHKRHPIELGQEDIETFLNHLAVNRRVSASTQSQALNALIFLYHVVLDQKPGWLEGLVRVRRKRHVPVVLTPEEVQTVIDCMHGTPKLMAQLLYVPDCAFSSVSSYGSRT